MAHILFRRKVCWPDGYNRTEAASCQLPYASHVIDVAREAVTVGFANRLDMHGL